MITSDRDDSAGLATRPLSLAAATLAALVAFSDASAAIEIEAEQEARVGKMLILKLPGNRKAGYRWHLNEEKSRGLDLVDVDQIAWTIPNDDNVRSMFFRNHSVLSIRIMPQAAGEANLAFDYFRLWGNKPFVKTHMVRVTISP
jgi:predicted secreted protein